MIRVVVKFKDVVRTLWLPEVPLVGDFINPELVCNGRRDTVVKRRTWSNAGVTLELEDFLKGHEWETDGDEMVVCKRCEISVIKHHQLDDARFSETLEHCDELVAKNVMER